MFSPYLPLQVLSKTSNLSRVVLRQLTTDSCRFANDHRRSTTLTVESKKYFALTDLPETFSPVTEFLRHALSLAFLPGHLSELAKTPLLSVL